jgi:hypothetical protein
MVDDSITAGRALLARRWPPARTIALGRLTGTGFAIVITFAVTLVG